MKIQNKNYNWGTAIFYLAYIFMVLPFFVFALGYLKIWIAIPVGCIVICSTVFALKDVPNIQLPVWNKKIALKIVCIIGIIFVWVLLSGIGKVAWQNGDHNCRNGIYEALVNNPWPVGHGYLTEAGTEIGMLVYYIGFWMVPALFGKLFGVEAGYLFQIFWAILGLTLVYLLICIWRKKISIWPLIVFIFFSGMDFIFNELFSEFNGRLFSTDFIEFSVGRYSFSSINVSVSAVFNQSIMAWMVVLILLLQRNHKNLIFLMSTVMLSSVFPFIGLIPLVVYWAFSKYEEREPVKERNWRLRSFAFLKSICTFQNVIGGGAIGLISFFYLKGNGSGQIIQRAYASIELPVNVSLMSEGLLANVNTLLSNPMILYVSFIMLEVGFYFLLVYKRQKKNPLYYIILVSLMVIPFIQVGTFVDFCMRASIPGILILYLFVVDYLEKNKKNIFYYLMIGILIISSASAFHEMGRAIQRWNEPRQTPVRLEALCNVGNFGGTPNTFFFQKLCKPLPKKELNTVLIEYCNYNIDEFFVLGPEFSVEENSMVASELVIEMDRHATSDVLFEDGGMLDDNSVFYQVYLNDYYMGALDYDNRQLILPQECFKEYAQELRIVINKRVKLYASDNFKMYAIR